MCGGRALRGLGTHDDDPAQRLAGLVEWEGEHVGGRAIAKKLMVQPSDHPIIDDGDFDARMHDVLGAKYTADRTADETLVESHEPLTVGYLDRDHADFGSGYLTRP